MSSFLGLLSKKEKQPVSPRLSSTEENPYEDDVRISSSNSRQRSKSKSKLKIPDDIPDASTSNEAEGEEVVLRGDDTRPDAEKGDVDEVEEVEERADEDVKPFDASTSLLVFHTGQVYVREDREVVVENGGRAVIRDLPVSIQPNSFHFHSNSDADASIVEQTFENGTESITELLDESVGQSVVLKLAREQGLSGKLIRATGSDVVLETEEGAVVSVLRSQVIAAEVNHQGFNREPSLHCVIETNNQGAHNAQLTYEASGINWSAEYTLVLRSHSEAHFTGWLTIENRSGKTFSDSAVALVAAPTLQYDPYDQYDSPRNNKKPGKNFISSISSSFNKKRKAKPKSTQNTSYVPRPITLVDGKSKQIRITDAIIPVEQINLFRKFTSPYTGEYGGPHSNHAYEGPKTVDKVIRWTNNKATHSRLGVELTAGNIDVIESVKGDTFLNLRHQDQLPFVRPNEEIVLVTGAHSYLRGERKVTELRHDAKTRTIRESVQIEIKNDGKVKEEVKVEDALWRWRNFTVSPCNPKYDDLAIPKQVMTWRLTVRPKSAEVIRYTVLYSDVPQ